MTFQKEISQKHKNGGWIDQFRGVCLALGPSGIFWRDVTLGGSYQARLGELGGNHPHFCNKMAWRAEEKRFSTLGKHISLKISEKKEKEEENPSQDASVTLLWRFRDQFSERSSFVLRSSLFVDLQPVSFWFRIFELILCTLRGPFLLCMFSSSFFYFRYSFSLF